MSKARELIEAEVGTGWVGFPEELRAAERVIGRLHERVVELERIARGYASDDDEWRRREYTARLDRMVAAYLRVGSGGDTCIAAAVSHLDKIDAIVAEKFAQHDGEVSP